MCPKLPFFASTECCVHLGRNDFLVRWPERRVEWIAHELSPKTFGRKSAAAPTLPKTNIGLRWLPSVSCVEEIPFEEMRGDPPQIGGDPDWAQYLERLYCPRCHEEMLFYGSLGSTDDFKPFSIMVNNGCGYLYHFACNRCHVISVISQCT